MPKPDGTKETAERALAVYSNRPSYYGYDEEFKRTLADPETLGDHHGFRFRGVHEFDSGLTFTIAEEFHTVLLSRGDERIEIQMRAREGDELPLEKYTTLYARKLVSFQP